jgi:hypothetical protein
MGRAILFTILAVIYLVTSTPQAAVALESSNREIEAKLRSMPLGTAVEIRLGDQGYNVTGRIREVTDKRLVLDQGTTTGEYTISEITSVQRYLAQSNHLELSSHALGAVVLSENIKAMTRDGSYVEGKVVQATEESLLLDVCKSEPKGRFRGESSIPTADIAIVYMKKSGGVAAPAGLGVLGGVLALIGSTYAAMHVDSGPAGALLAIGGTTTGAVLGAYAGQKLVQKTVTISVTR